MRKHKDFVFKNYKLNPRVLKLKGKAGWDSTIPCLQEAKHGPSSWLNKFAEGNVPPAKHVYFYHCPSCRKVESSQRGSFQRFNMDLKIRCGFCAKGNPCKDWKCQCERQWHSCPLHMDGYTCKATKDVSLAGQPGVKPFNLKAGQKRSAAGSTLRMRRAKRLRSGEQRSLKRTGIVLESNGLKALKAPTALGPILGDRFSHLHAPA